MYSMFPKSLVIVIFSSDFNTSTFNFIFRCEMVLKDNCYLNIKSQKMINRVVVTIFLTEINIISLNLNLRFQDNLL